MASDADLQDFKLYFKENQGLKIPDKYNDLNEKKYPLIFSEYAKSTLKYILSELRKSHQSHSFAIYIYSQKFLRKNLYRPI